MSRVITDSKMKMRDKLSFFIFIAAVIVSLCINCFATIANPNALVDSFCSREVVEALRDDITLYTEDLCLKNSLPDDFIKETVTYDSTVLLQKSFISGKLGASADFNENAFDSYLEDFKQDMIKNINEMIDEKNVRVDSNVSDDAVDVFCSDVAKYVDSRINLSYIYNVAQGINIMHKLATVLFVLFGVSGIAAIVYMSLKGGKTYRVIRHLSYSALGASLVGFADATIICIVKATKNLVIYPTYVAQAFLNYVNMSVKSIMVSSLCLLTVFFLLITVVWKIKRNECD